MKNQSTLHFQKVLHKIDRFENICVLVLLKKNLGLILLNSTLKGTSIIIWTNGSPWLKWSLTSHVHTVVLFLEQNNINSKQNMCHSDRENIVQQFKLWHRHLVFFLSNYSRQTRFLIDNVYRSIDNFAHW